MVALCDRGYVVIIHSYGGLIATNREMQTKKIVQSRLNAPNYHDRIQLHLFLSFTLPTFVVREAMAGAIKFVPSLHILRWRV